MFVGRKSFPLYPNPSSIAFCLSSCNSSLSPTSVTFFSSSSSSSSPSSSSRPPRIPSTISSDRDDEKTNANHLNRIGSINREKGEIFLSKKLKPKLERMERERWHLRQTATATTTTTTSLGVNARFRATQVAPSVMKLLDDLVSIFSLSLPHGSPPLLFCHLSFFSALLSSLFLLLSPQLGASFQTFSGSW
jgi:hypothetical protein